ncbi:hypothetical protein ACFVT6_19530 [Streptomyces sp. NPDC058049]|uniref:hypothetical protein n=1 Tax=Streptomyces sp. NPDC058049 TaxID=3346314 RepID=UPI0036E0EC8A
MTAKQMINGATNSSWRDLPDEPRPPPDRPRTADQVRGRTIEAIAWLLGAGAEYVPPGHDAHHTLAVEISRIAHTAERLRKTAKDARRASE